MTGMGYIPGLGSFLVARIGNVAETGTELGLVIMGPPHALPSYWVVVESKEVEVHLNHRSVEIPGSKVTIKAAEATEAAPKQVVLAKPYIPTSWGELVAVCKTIGGGSTFVNLTPVLT